MKISNTPLLKDIAPGWSDDEKVTVQGSPALALAGATVGFCVGFSPVSLFSSTAKSFKENLGLSPMEASWLIAMPTLSGSLLRIPCGAMVDTSGGRAPFLALLCMSVVGMIGLLVSLRQLDEASKDSTGLYPMLLGYGVLVGCGIATFSVGIGQISYWFPQHEHGRANAIYAGVGNLAPGALTIALPLILKWEGLFNMYLMWLGFLLIGTLVYVCLGYDAWYFQLCRQGISAEQACLVASKFYGQTLFPSGGAAKGLIIAAATWKTWALVAIYFVTFGGLVALTGWFPTYWTAFHEVSDTTAGFYTGLFSLGGSLLRVIGGPIADKLGGEVTLLASNALICLGACLLVTATSESLKTALVGESALALGMGIANAAVFKLVPQLVPQAVGGAAGWVGGLGAFGGFAIPPMMAAFVSQYGSVGYSLSFSIFVALACLAILLAVLLKLSMQLQS